MRTEVYQEPYRLPAWILATLVHGAFFSLLYFGISWQTQRVELRSAAMSVELWGSLPAPPPVEVKVEENKVEEVKVEAVVPPPPEPVVKPDIVIPEKKPKKPVEIKPEVVKPKPEIKKPEVKKPEVKPTEVKKTEAKTAEVKKVEVSAVKSDTKNGVAGGVPGGSAHGTSAGDQMARDKLAQDAAIGKIVDEYSDKIRAKIKRNIVEPPEVSKDARAEFLVTVLPGGRVLPPRLVKSSGNAAYDSAVERAILKSEPLPMPEDAGLFKQFRELKLSFQPVK